jgi:hypothetical protein
MAVRILNHILRALHGTAARDEDASAVYYYEDWRRPLLAEAARKHGKPFKCAGDELPREVILGGKDLVVIDFDPCDLAGSPRSVRLVGESKFQEAAIARLGAAPFFRQQSSGD